ncbi:lipopolysaccharide assembly LapA domain-containing protein [Corynebacterium yudongzhengii]|nr:lipopolysaccharide assembly protein LapA domain-containing protein [Corynebacterium yudongzhengii]
MTSPNDPGRTEDVDPAEAAFDSQPSQPSLPEQKEQPEPEERKIPSSLAGGTWAALIIGALLLILLIVFIVQNQPQVEVNMFAWSWQFPAGIAYLISAIIGALIMALMGGWRMLELRRQIRRSR